MSVDGHGEIAAGDLIGVAREQIRHPRSIGHAQLPCGDRHGFSTGSLRIHLSIIVNMARIHTLELHKEGEYEVVLNSGTRLRLSGRFRKRLRQNEEMVLGYFFNESGNPRP